MVLSHGGETMPVELRVLGPLQLHDPGGRDLDPLMRQSKRLALLAYLAAATPHGFQRRDTLLALFWPEVDSSRARSALNQALYVLRTELGDDAIMARGDADVAVNRDIVRCDVDAFEAALDARHPADALALYRGELLHGFFIEGAPEFERWVDAERQRLRHRASDGAWAVAESLAVEGNGVDAARWARRAADFAPDDEAVVRRLMVFLHQLGDRAAAIGAYEAFAWRLSSEYELEPSSETRAVADAIRQEAAHPVTVRLERLLPTPVPPLLRRINRHVPLRWVAGVAVGVALLAMGAWIGRPRPPQPPNVVRFTLASRANVVSSGVAGSTIAISPRNDRIAFLGESGGETQIFMRRMDDLGERAMPGTRGAYLPFFSPDGRWLGFVSDGRIRRVPVDGGAAITICDAGSTVYGASWGEGDVIVFATAVGLWRARVAGSRAEPMALADTANGIRYRWPEVLPGGRDAVFTLVDRSGFRLASARIGTGAITPLNIEGTHPRVVASGHLVFARQDGGLFAAPFDPRAIEVIGPAVPVAEGVRVGFLGAAKMGLSRGGALAFLPEQIAGRSLALVDRGGHTDSLPLPPLGYATARLSPDGRRIATDVIDPASLGRDVWLFDLVKGDTRRLTNDSTSSYPRWSADGLRIGYITSDGGREPGLAIRAMTMLAPTASELLARAQHGQVLQMFAPSGRAMLVQRESPRTGLDIWVLPLGADAPEAKALLRSEAQERAGALSPDGRWLAYVSNETGRDEVFVRGFPTGGPAVRVSDAGGQEPSWAPSGREIFYRDGHDMVSMAVTTGAGFLVMGRERLFADSGYLRMSNGTGYDVHPDGRRFLMVKRGTEAKEIVVVLNLFAAGQP